MSNTKAICFLADNFNTVEELRNSINSDEFPFVYEKSLRIQNEEGEWIDYAFPLHWSVNDRSGDSLVLEYTKDGRKIFFNSISVFANHPTFDWHLVNLNNYVNLQRDTLLSKEYTDHLGNKHTLKSPGDGSGMLGVPGDFTSPSRFVRASASVQLGERAKTANDAIIQAWHTISTLDVKLGVFITLFQNFLSITDIITLEN